MRESIFEGEVGGGPFVLQNEVFANEGGKGRLPCEGMATIDGVINQEGEGCCCEGFGGGTSVEEG